MDWTTMLQLRIGGGLMAIALAYVICVFVKEIVALTKKASAFINSFHGAHCHHAQNGVSGKKGVKKVKRFLDKTQVNEFYYKLH